VAAGVYNVLWGLYCVADPQWLFRMTGGPAADRSEVVSALGLVIGLYGLLYLEVARSPEQGAAIVAVGLAGKVLGPIGVLWVVESGGWPASTFVVCLTNDFVWWAPFALYLFDATRAMKSQSRTSLLGS
jgi:hypothetical protein